MSKGKTVTQTTTDPAQMAMYEDLYGKAQGIAEQPFIPYTGARVAGFNPDQFKSFDATRGMFNQSMGFNPRDRINTLANQGAPSLLDTNISAYQNPFQEQVIDNAMADLNRGRQMQIQSDQDAAIGRGAFGGSRSALLEAETNRNFADRAGNLASSLRSQGFDRATSLAGQDMSRDMQNRQFQSGLLGNQLSDQYRNLGLLSGIGSQQQGLQQAGMDAGYNEFMRAIGYGPQQLNLLTQGLSGMPLNTGTSDQYKPGTADYLSSALGLFALSDKRLKENIKLVDEVKGHNIYTWDWNDTAKKLGVSLPSKGVIAQEILQSNPEAVALHESGYLMVNYGAL